jgi:hypothetical protein
VTRDYPATALTEDQRALQAEDLANIAAVAVRLAAMTPPARPPAQPIPRLDMSELDESALMGLLAALVGRILSRDAETGENSDKRS